MQKDKNDFTAHDMKEILSEIRVEYGTLVRTVTEAVGKLQDLAKAYHDSWLRLARDNAQRLILLAIIVVIIIGACFVENIHIKAGDWSITKPIKAMEQGNNSRK